MDFDIEKLQTLLDGAVASGEEDSCQLAIYKSGRLAVDICAGKNCRSNTLFPVYSVSKGLTSTLAHILYEEGRLDFEAPVSEYWPEFGCNGKENIKVWHIFSHRAGLWQMPLIDKFADQADWQKMVEYMQNATPEDPGGKCHYHGITFGWLAGEVIARAGKKSFRELFREKIAAPLQITDEWFFGTDNDAETRLILPKSISYANFCDWRTVFIENPAIRSACIPSANGIGSARAVARVYAALSGNGVNGVRLLKDETIKLATQSRRASFDPLPEGIASWAHFGLGWALAGTPENPGAIFGHGGAMGAEGFAVPELELAVGFTKNKYNTTHPVHPLRDRISEALNLKIRHW